jgi:hypothetical protein
VINMPSMRSRNESDAAHVMPYMQWTNSHREEQACLSCTFLYRLSEWCNDARRPATLEQAKSVRRLTLKWPVPPDERATIKRILNMADCRIGVADVHLWAESRLDSTLILVNIEKTGDDWVSVPY